MIEVGASTQTYAPGDDSVHAAEVHLYSPGTRLANRYEIRGVIDTGGYSVVYLAHDRELRRDIALKVLRQDRMSAGTLMRFRREVAIARDTSSPHLVRVFDIETSDGAVYLTMELIDGESLKKRLRNGPLAIGDVVRIAASIAEGLDALHQLGVVHRDVKPGNVLVDRDGQVKLADFGLARHVDTDAANPTTTGAIVGTLAYLSPEQAIGKGVDHRSDLYSLGVLLYEMLTGTTPFSGDSALGALLARLKTVPPDVRRLRPDCPRWLAAIVRRLLEREPGDRYQTARDVLADLRRARGALLPRRVRRVVIASAVALIVLFAALWKVRAWNANARFSHLSAGGDGVISAVNRNGEVLWQLRGYDVETTMRYGVLEHGHGGRREVVVVLRAPRDVRMDVVHTLTFLDAGTGKVRHRVRLPDIAKEFPYLPTKYMLAALFTADLDDDGGEEVLATFAQYPEWPSYTILYEPRLQRARPVFAATGHYHYAGAGDVDGDGENDLFFQGIHNAYGWYNAAAAAKIQPPVNDPGPYVDLGATPDIAVGTRKTYLLWHTYLPRGLQGAGTTARVDGKLVHYEYVDGRRVTLGIDGLPPDATNRAGRVAAKQEAFEQLRASERLTASGSHDLAIAAGNEALRQAGIAGDALLVEAVQIRRGRLLVRAGRIDEALRHYEQLSRDTVAAPEIAMEAAEALHLQGEVVRAVEWYRRGLSYARANGTGRSRHEFIEGLVLALAELNRWDEAVAEAAQFMDAYKEPFREWPSYYREFARWRFGAGPADVSQVTIPEGPIDIVVYWNLEFANANGTSPQALLPRFDANYEAQSPTRSAMLSLHAEVLQKLGRADQARQMIERAMQYAELDKTQTTIARGHLPLVRARYERIAGGR